MNAPGRMPGAACGNSAEGEALLQLQQRLQQAEARVQAQAEALQGAADEIQRLHTVEHRAQALHHRCEGLETELRVTKNQLGASYATLHQRDVAAANFRSNQREVAEMAAKVRDHEVNTHLEVEALKAELAASNERARRTHAFTIEFTTDDHEISLTLVFTIGLFN